PDGLRSGGAHARSGELDPLAAKNVRERGAGKPHRGDRRPGGLAARRGVDGGKLAPGGGERSAEQRDVARKLVEIADLRHVHAKRASRSDTGALFVPADRGGDDSAGGDVYLDA